MFLNGPGCTNGTINAALGLDDSNFKMLTSMSVSSPMSSKNFSKGALSLVTQLAMKALKRGSEEIAYALPKRSTG